MDDFLRYWELVKRSVYTWIVLLIALAAYELRTVLDKKPHTLPLTIVVVTWVPGILTMVFLSWLWVHFFIRYWQSGYWWFR
jgi:hypothetical protein